MEAKNGSKSLKERIRSGNICREDVIRRLAELAFGKANDCVRLALHVYTPLHQGGAVCEDVALQVVEALATIYGTYKIQHCSFDSQTSLFHSTVLVTFRQARAE